LLPTFYEEYLPPQGRRSIPRDLSNIIIFSNILFLLKAWHAFC